MDTIFKFCYWLLKTTIAAIVFLMAAELIIKYTGAERWQVGVVLCVLGLGAYCANVILARSYTINQTLELAYDEKKTGFGTQPKWLAYLGLLGIAGLAAAEILIIIHVFS